MKINQAFLNVCRGRCDFIPSILMYFKTHSNLFITALLFSSTKNVIANEASNEVINAGPMSSSYLLQLFFGLLVVIVCIVALSWFIKKMNKFQSLTDYPLKIVGGLSIGNREKVVLLQVGDEQLLIGVAQGNVSKLHVLDKNIEINAANANNNFSDKLKKVMSDTSAKSRGRK